MALFSAILRSCNLIKHDYIRPTAWCCFHPPLLRTPGHPCFAAVGAKNMAMRSVVTGPTIPPPSEQSATRSQEDQRCKIPLVSESDRKLVPRGVHDWGEPSVQATGEGSTSAAPDCVAASTSDSAPRDSLPKSTPADAYTDWELKALILPLIPLRGSIKLSALLELLPPAASQILSKYRGGPGAYVRQNLTKEVMTVYGDHLVRVPASAVAENGPAAVAANPHEGQGKPFLTPSGSSKMSRRDTNLEPPPFSAVTTPPPHQQHLQMQMRGRGGGAGGGGVAPVPRNPSDIMEMLIEYVPTFYVNLTSISDQLPADITRHFAGSTLLFFIKRFKHYVDVRTQHSNTEARLRPDFSHPKRGVADSKYASGGGSGVGMLAMASHLRRPPRNSEANLIMFLLPKIPDRYTPLSDVLQEVTGMVSRHPSFDPRLGIMGLLEKYPEYFQVVDGKIRVRPYRSAPNSIDDLNAETSSLPVVFGKVLRALDEAMTGDQAAVGSERFSREELAARATMSTGRLFALLTSEEKKEVKMSCRSFPRFLRMHGAEIVVSTDNFTVKKFFPELEKCAETVARQSLGASSISPDDPILRIPAEMDVSTNADWAVKELYDALPLMQCAALDEILGLVPIAVRDALPKGDQLLEHLSLYPDYFTYWKFPDDAAVTVIQRAKIDFPVIEKDDITRAVLPLVPQGGIDAEKLLRRVPLPLQRFFYQHGLKKVLQSIPDYFVVAGDRIIRVG